MPTPTQMLAKVHPTARRLVKALGEELEIEVMDRNTAVVTWELGLNGRSCTLAGFTDKEVGAANKALRS